MKLTFCGGAGEVGASCYLISIDGKNILLDCGIRLTSSKDNLPDLRLIQDQGGLDAIIVSHAHTDHTGALPAISRQFPNAKIYMTHMTKDLTRVLLYDSLKIMEREAEIPIYAEKHVREMLDRIVCFSPQFTFKPFNDSKISVTLYNAGHIAGAVSIYITGKEGSLFYSGDFSGFRQNSIEGASIPKLRPDVAIVESTYGDKLHSNRQIEERRLITTVQKVIDRNGKILIPAFALGRAQEIILILKRAMDKKLLEKCPVYVDGMVKDICRVYKLNPNYLRINLAKKIFRGTDIFYDDEIVPIENPKMRRQVAEQDQPCVIISSSGMLTGGPSQFYASKLAGDSKNFIAITGYQDEESPGRDLLNLLNAQDSKERVIKLGTKTVKLECEVGKYGLSAHGDLGEILGLLGNIYPLRIFLVHGNPEVIQSLGHEIQKDVNAKVFAPINGETYELKIEVPRKQKRIKTYPCMKQTKPINEDSVEKLWKFIIENVGTRHAFSKEELSEIWGNNENIDSMGQILNNTIYFEPDRRRMFLYRAVDKDKIKELKAPRIMELNEMLDFVDEIFGPETGLYKKGAKFEEKIALLNFNFPDVAKKEHIDKIKEFEENTGWKVEINTNINTAAINDVIYELFPKNINIKKISYMGQDSAVKVVTDEKITNNDLKDVALKFKEITGLPLLINENLKIAKSTENVEQMEQNKALSLIDLAFSNKLHKPYKKSVKMLSDGKKYIKLSFVSKQIGEKYSDIIHKLQEKTGYYITISDSCNQIEIINITKRLMRDIDLSLKRNPSIFVSEGIVEISPTKIPDKALLAKQSNKLSKATGFELRLK